MILIGISFLIFVVLSFFGDDPAEITASKVVGGAIDEIIQEIREELGLNKSIILRYFDLVCGFYYEGKTRR